MVRILLLVCLSAGLAFASRKTSYHGYKVLRTQQLSPSQSLFLSKLETTSGFDFWQSAHPNGNADIMSDPENLSRLEEILNSKRIGYSVMVEDVERLVVETKGNSSTRPGVRKLDWTDYYSYEEITAFIEQLAGENDFISAHSIGKSYEARDMKIIRITKAGAGKPNIWIEAGIHAREWIAPAMATYLINELVNGEGAHFLDELNFHILPSANPDGYEYSRSTKRLWRKTRSDTGSDFGCKGVDGNRNFDYHFGESGVSDNKCSDVYPGEGGFSEKETRNIRDYVQSLEPVPILAHCLHSYSQLWLYPYGYAFEALPDNHEEIKELGAEAVEALAAVHGKVFDNINSADLYPAAGAADDWYKGVLGARFAYTTELRDKGRHGFLLPQDQIIPSGEELWAAFDVVFQKMVELA